MAADCQRPKQNTNAKQSHPICSCTALVSHAREQIVMRSHACEAKKPTFFLISGMKFPISSFIIMQDASPVHKWTKIVFFLVIMSSFKKLTYIQDLLCKAAVPKNAKSN